MKKSLKINLAFLVVMAGVTIFGITMKSCKNSNQAQFNAPLFDNIGAYEIKITANSESAQKFFTQGVIMANAFNHAEAARSFREAIRLDSLCAMAHWGLAYVLGPNYNTKSDLGDRQEIRTAVDRAVALSKDIQPWEKGIIQAIAAKFPKDSETQDEAYAEAMRTLYAQFPNNEFIVTLFAESLMNLHAWDLYTRKGGEAKPWTPEIREVIEHALSLNENSPLANHLYIHAMEAAADVEKAIPSANRLKTLVPAAGHLVHMPSHVFINTGDYHEGSLANEAAVIVDSIYIAECLVKGVYPQMYYPHNWHFLSATAALEGRGARSIEAAFKTAAVIDKYYLTQEGFETTQHYSTIPYNVLVKFAQWEKILALPEPELLYQKAIWHYARGMAFANTGELQKASSALNYVNELSQTAEVQNLKIWEINSGYDVVSIAQLVLDAEIKRYTNDWEGAITSLTKAIAIEDALNYNEPPDWFFSVRHSLGDIYLELKRFNDAERIYREDLTYWVKNGFALNGLYHSLLGQERKEEAAAVKKQFDQAWRHADSELKYSRIDEAKRKDLAIRIDENSPGSLVYIAGNFCSK